MTFLFRRRLTRILIEFVRARPNIRENRLMRSIDLKNRSNVLSNVRSFWRVMDSGIVVVVVWLMKTNEKRDFIQKVCPTN